MITDRDNKIIKEWFEPYFHSSINQIERSYFRDSEYSYIVAARRLKEICATGQVNVYHDTSTNRNIYIYNAKKSEKRIGMPTASRMIVLDVLAEMKYNGFNIETFIVEKFWMDGAIRSDGLAIFTVGKSRFHFFIEVQLADHPHRLEKYDTLYQSGEVQKFLGKNFYPRILFISDKDYSDLHINSADIIRLDTKLHMFPSILVKKEKGV